MNRRSFFASALSLLGALPLVGRLVPERKVLRLRGAPITEIKWVREAMVRLWTGKGDAKDFNDPRNWEPQGKPQAGDTVRLPMPFKTCQMRLHALQYATCHNSRETHGIAGTAEILLSEAMPDVAVPTLTYSEGCELGVSTDQVVTITANEVRAIWEPHR